MMRRQGIVDCVWEDPKAIVQEEEEKQDNEGKNTKLDAGTDLYTLYQQGDLCYLGQQRTILRVMFKIT